MKVEIHPKYFPKAKIKCACGNMVVVGSAKESIDIEVCSSCHPFFTGKGKLIDSAGRVERFKSRAAKKSSPKKRK
ncbi:50S ribosomal protein L31 [Candidatus Giovannonibacteria bacterium RIFCSPLOWO2_02_FULL_45_14]|uniref:Large ribosomal subunit protein bL31 n=1 Tax=Candidatus Giovannonibacteria bacterium RIFCSPLOWO2_12_FULL_44_15 TaxID=1798364 RepID=A0A1F5Y0D6_9BACT|nr:MAG: 50S ribosomal protein L31 [Candidatus Giovannonibacteria bacterium RIFCSPHIGHO2_02_FULL_44_31]OGF76295.1 MAG: 50S ribosomal protein L31 [Candidatus Giovannonibacteria bacterium RIFCSPHIGHO2_12_FULL_44_29]OGF91328.1 MAG: 50S ribosomal protein L31 [Candidatus Giovannonibacteria bacterium RIFCSPLOWO2_02_FULL_45_14]OGF93678.1 MAG: 50S ribosomal protein L31 [Candidatus Giovannonibacteria bacterium RIFCSPLOWO2_12_FULL_44_15]